MFFEAEELFKYSDLTFCMKKYIPYWKNIHKISVLTFPYSTISTFSLCKNFEHNGWIFINSGMFFNKVDKHWEMQNEFKLDKYLFTLEEALNLIGKNGKFFHTDFSLLKE